MAATTFNELMASMRRSLLMRIIGINVAIWLVLRISAIVVFLATGTDGEHIVSRWVELPSDPSMLATHWWGIVTYMFAQYGVLHLLFNMLWLYWFGRIYLEISTESQLTRIYLAGGIAGGVLFLLAYNLLPAFRGHEAWLIGSSAAVLAVVTACAIRMPDYSIGLLLIGMVKLKWIAIVTILIDIISVSGANAGGHIAHIGGIIAGAVYALVLKYRPQRNILRARKVKIKPKAASKPKTEESAEAANIRELDAILDKIRKSGYAGLTAEERKKLFEASSRIK